MDQNIKDNLFKSGYKPTTIATKTRIERRSMIIRDW